MKTTSITALVGVGGFCAAATLIVIQNLYNVMSTVPISVGLTLLIMAVLCCMLAWWVKGQIKENRIGFDRSQLEPTRVATFLIIGKTSAWTGAIFSGIYVGMGVYVIPRMGDLVAAANDAPGVITAAIGGVVLCAAGLWLERACAAPPPTDGDSVR